MVTINRYIKALLHQAGGHQGSHKAHQAGNQSKYEFDFKKVGKNSTFWENRNTLFLHSANKHYPTSLFMNSSVF